WGEGAGGGGGGGGGRRRGVEGGGGVAGERAHIGSLAALGNERGVIAVRHLDQFEPVNLDWAWRDIHHLAVAREVIGALARNFHRRVARRHLRDLTGEARQQRSDGRGGRARGAARGDAAFGVVGNRLLAPAHGEAVGLAPLHDERNGLGRLPERDRQQARGQRVERAGMPRAFGLEQAFHHAHRVGRA